MRLKYPLNFVGETSAIGQKTIIKTQKNKGFQSLENPYSFMAERQGTDSRLRASVIRGSTVHRTVIHYLSYFESCVLALYIFSIRNDKEAAQLSFLFLYCIKLCRAAKKVNHLCKVKTPLFTIHQRSGFNIHYSLQKSVLFNE